MVRLTDGLWTVSAIREWKRGLAEEGQRKRSNMGKRLEQQD
jgi:hypothetical protein